MRICDPHCHMYARVTDDYEKMATAGICRILEPAFWLGEPRRHPGSFFDYFSHLRNFEHKQAGNYGIDLRVALALNPRESNDDRLRKEVIAGLPEFLQHRHCVAVGEIGFDDITAKEDESYRRQLDLAFQHGKRVLIHSAHRNKLESIRRKDIVAGVNTQGSDLVVRNDIVYTGPQSLNARTIATFPPGSIQDTVLRDWLKKNNLTPDKDVFIKGMTPGDAVTAILAGKVDGIFLPTPSPSTVVNLGKGKVVVYSGEMYPNHTCCVLVVSGKLIREHPEIVRQIIKTNDKAVAWNQQNLDEAAQIYSTKTGASLADVKASLAEWDGSWASDPNVIVEPVLDYAKIQYELGFIKKPLTKEVIFDLTFYQKS